MQSFLICRVRVTSRKAVSLAGKCWEPFYVVSIESDLDVNEVEVYDDSISLRFGIVVGVDDRPECRNDAGFEALVALTLGSSGEAKG